MYHTNGSAWWLHQFPFTRLWKGLKCVWIDWWRHNAVSCCMLCSWPQAYLPPILGIAPAYPSLVASGGNEACSRKGLKANCIWIWQDQHTHIACLLTIISLFSPKESQPSSCVTGLEHKDICQILLGLIADLPLPEGYSPACLIRAVWALPDFLYLAQYPSHSANTLTCLEDTLSRFHDNKNIFVDLGARAHFNFPKLHSLIHCTSSIKLFGTTDNYNMGHTFLCGACLSQNQIHYEW